MYTLEEIQEKLQGKNLSEVAKRVGCTRSYICALAKGKRLNPSYNMVKKLGEVLDNE